jgi:hypothetical protein
MGEGHKQAISELRDLVILSERDIERGLGGSLPLAARHALSSAIGRAFEVGAAYGRLSLLEQQQAEYVANLTPPEPPDNDPLPITPYIGHPAARRNRRRYNGGG